jgi:hypothetical protein
MSDDELRAIYCEGWVAGSSMIVVMDNLVAL